MRERVDAPYVTIELQPSSRYPRTGWVLFGDIFHFTGSDTEWQTLWEIADAIRSILEFGDTLPEIAETTEDVNYQALGKATFSTGENPVTDQVNVSVGLTIGIEA